MTYSFKKKQSRSFAAHRCIFGNVPGLWPGVRIRPEDPYGLLQRQRHCGVSHCPAGGSASGGEHALQR